MNKLFIGLLIAAAGAGVLFFLDKKNNIEIIARELSTETNHCASELHSVEELLTFAERAGFPSHGIILKKSKNDFSDIELGRITESYMQMPLDFLIAVATK